MADYSVYDVSEMLHVNPETVRRWIKRGKLKSIKNSNKEGHVISESNLYVFATGTKYTKYVDDSKTNLEHAENIISDIEADIQNLNTKLEMLKLLINKTRTKNKGYSS